jgi:hypothetical protein
MPYQTHLAYFRPSGRFLAFASVVINREALVDIWAAIVELRQLGELPGLRPKAGRDLLILVDVFDHPERKLHLIIPPFVNDEDVTPVRIPINAEDISAPLVRIPLDELPVGRTTTRDVIRPEADEEVTPVDVAVPKLDDK